MSDIKIDLTLKDLDSQTASAIVAYLGGKSKAPGQERATSAVETKALVTKADLEEKAEKATKKTKKSAKAKPPAEEPEEAEPEAEDDDWDDDGEKEDGDNSKYAAIKKWRELATVLVGDGFNTAPTLLAKCKELADICPALEKIPADNLVTRCDRAIEVLGA